MNTALKSFALAAFLALGSASTSMAAPTWIGVYGSFERHSAGNPGTFTILMNQDYYGLHAEVGVQVNGGSWTVMQMNYAGNVSGNSKWQVVPAQPFPAGATVKFYFHGYDNWGGNIWDSQNGANYSFTADASSALAFSGPQSLGLSGPAGDIDDACVYGGKAYALAGGSMNIGVIGTTGIVWTGWYPQPGGGLQIAVNSSHVIVVQSDGGNVKVWRSADGGGSFSGPTPISVTTGTIQSIDVAARGSQVVVVCAVSMDAAYYNAHFLYSIKSTDNGASWGAPQAVDSQPMGWFDGLSIDANASRFFVVYRYVEQAYSTSIRAANSTDGLAWYSAYLFGDKASSTFGSLVTGDGAYVVLDPYYDNVTRLARFNGSTWEINTIAHPEGYASGRAVKLGTTGTDLYFYRSQAYPSTAWDSFKSNDQGMNWTPAGALVTPNGVPSFAPFLQNVLSKDGRIHLVWVNSDWRYGANIWQVSLKTSGGPVNWVGNTIHSPANSQLTSTNNLIVTTESWPAGNAVGAGIVFSTDGSNWTWSTMTPAGRSGNNDKWSVNLGMFFSGTTIRYAVYAEDGNGVKKWDNNNGQDYRAIVQSNTSIHAPFFYSIDPYRSDLERVRANGRAKDANLSFGSFTASQTITITTRPIESGNGEGVQFGPVEMVSYLAYSTSPTFANSTTVYGDFHGGGLSNKPIYDYTTFNLGQFPAGTTIYFWLGSSNSKGAGYAQVAGEAYKFNVQ